MPSYVASSPTSASPAAVWAVWSDPARWSLWDPAVASVELRGPFTGGTRGRVHTAAGQTTSVRLARVEPGVRWTEVSRLPLARVRVDHELVGGSGDLLVRHGMRFTGLLGGPWSRLLGPRLAQHLPETARRVAQLAAEEEQEGRRAGPTGAPADPDG